MGNVLQVQGRIAEAGTHYERSLAIYIKMHDTEEHPDVANSLNNMGTVLKVQGRLTEAGTHHEPSLVIRLKVHESVFCFSGIPDKLAPCFGGGRRVFLS